MAPLTLYNFETRRCREKRSLAEDSGARGRRPELPQPFGTEPIRQSANRPCGPITRWTRAHRIGRHRWLVCSNGEGQ